MIGVPSEAAIRSLRYEILHPRAWHPASKISHAEALLLGLSLTSETASQMPPANVPRASPPGAPGGVLGSVCELYPGPGDLFLAARASGLMTRGGLGLINAGTTESW